jgi:surface polysaccharide O-acyltransferase-like enzyme
MRNAAIDIARGFAVVSMMFFHTLDFFSSNLHLYGDFWLKSGLNQLNWMPIFFVTVGISLGFPTRNPKRIVKRAVLYTILGVFLCFWIGSLDADVVFIIGFYTLLSLPFIYAFKKKKGILLVAVFATSFLLREVLLQNQIIVYPFSYGFTIWISLPFIFLGYYLSDGIISGNSKIALKSALVLLPLTTVSLLYWPVNFYEQTLTFVLFDSMIVCVIYVLTMNLQDLKAMKSFAFFGQHPLAFFIFPWLVVYKALALTQTLRTFDLPTSLILTLLVLLSFSLLVSRKTRLISKVPKKVALLLDTLR